MRFSGILQPGKHDASRWLGIFNAAYAIKTGMAIFPGSLNLALDSKFQWTAPIYQKMMIKFDRTEYGGDRNILLLPCRLWTLQNREAFLWTTTTAVEQAPDQNVIEIITDVRLRDVFGLQDSDWVGFEIYDVF